SSRKRMDQHWKILFDNLPDIVEVDVEIRMDEPMPHADDLVPWKHWHQRACLRLHSDCRLANFLNAVDDRSPQHQIRIQALARSPCRKLSRLSRRLKHVRQPDAIIFGQFRRHKAAS